METIQNTAIAHLGSISNEIDKHIDREHIEPTDEILDALDKLEEIESACLSALSVLSKLLKAANNEDSP